MKRLFFRFLTSLINSSIMSLFQEPFITWKMKRKLSILIGKIGELLGYPPVIFDLGLLTINKKDKSYLIKELDPIIQQVNKEENPFYKWKLIYQYVISSIQYDKTRKNNSALLAYKTGKAMCGGYAQMIYFLAKQTGLEVSYVVGQANDDLHIWNKAKIFNQLYYLDATWEKHNDPDYRFFMLSRKTLEQTHIF